MDLFQFHHLGFLHLGRIHDGRIVACLVDTAIARADGGTRHSLSLGVSRRCRSLHRGRCGRSLGLSPLGLFGGAILGSLLFFVVMDTPHVVSLIPAAREAVSWFGSVTVHEFTQEGIESVVMESMGFPFMPEEAGVG